MLHPANSQAITNHVNSAKQPSFAALSHSPEMQTRSTLQGFTLFELIVTIGLATLVLTLGLPSFGGMIANHRLRVEVNALFHAIHLARKESIVRRRVVTLCPTRDGFACERDLDWSSGWIMFVNRDRNGDSQRDPDEPILQHFAVCCRFGHPYCRQPDELLFALD